MPLTIYGVHEYPHDFLITKVEAPIEQCVFLLDFERSIERVRWFFVRNSWIGFTVALIVPVIHLGQQKGGFFIGVRYGESYFADIPKLWMQHAGKSSSRPITAVSGLEVVADFGRHFPNDC